MSLPWPQDTVYGIQAGISLYYCYISGIGLLPWKSSSKGKSQMFFPGGSPHGVPTHRCAFTASIQNQHQQLQTICLLPLVTKDCEQICKENTIEKVQLSGKWDKMQQDFTKGVFCEANPVPSVSRGRFLNKEKEGDSA